MSSPERCCVFLRSGLDFVLLVSLVVLPVPPIRMRDHALLGGVQREICIYRNPGHDLPWVRLARVDVSADCVARAGKPVRPSPAFGLSPLWTVRRELGAFLYIYNAPISKFR
jgi:hypothetical protein